MANPHVQCIIYCSPRIRASPDDNDQEWLQMNWCWAFLCGISFLMSGPLLFQFGPARLFFLQITNTVISLLIQTGPSFSNSADYHKAVKQSVTLVQGSNDEKWHTAAALPLNPFLHYGTSPLTRFLFSSFNFKQLLFTKLHFKRKRHILTCKNKTLAHPKFNSEYFS